MASTTSNSSSSKSSRAALRGGGACKIGALLGLFGLAVWLDTTRYNAIRCDARRPRPITTTATTTTTTTTVLTIVFRLQKVFPTRAIYPSAVDFGG